MNNSDLTFIPVFSIVSPLCFVPQLGVDLKQTFTKERHILVLKAPIDPPRASVSYC